MKLIGVTGGIASGKTLVTDYLTALGAPVVDADVISHKVTEPGSPVLKEIAAAFGEGYLDENGELKRQKLGDLIFQREEYRLKLNAILHPKIGSSIQEELRRCEEAGEAVVIFSAPLMVEGGRNSMTDEIWVVALNPGEQIRRLMARDGIDEEAANARLQSQSSLEEKLAIADRIIDNNGSVEETKSQVKALWEEINGEVNEQPTKQTKT